ncbi:MAG: hypothetical protein, partial [Olavius algarvensis Gamma 1 endosymbiont]
VPTASIQPPPSRQPSNASFTSIITTSRKKVYTTAARQGSAKREAG